jgi:hypothetical protein
MEQEQEQQHQQEQQPEQEELMEEQQQQEQQEQTAMIPTDTSMPLTNTKRPRGRPKLAKTTSPTGAVAPSPTASTDGSPTMKGEAGSSAAAKTKPPLKKTDKRLQANKEQAKKDREGGVIPTPTEAKDPSISLPQPLPPSAGPASTPTGALTEPLPSTGNPLKVRSISTGVFTQTLLAALATGPPRSVSEISALIPNVTLDQLQGILDVSRLCLLFYFNLWSDKSMAKL